MRWPIWLIGLVWIFIGLAVIRVFTPRGYGPLDILRLIYYRISGG